MSLECGQNAEVQTSLSGSLQCCAIARFLVEIFPRLSGAPSQEASRRALANEETIQANKKTIQDNAAKIAQCNQTQTKYAELDQKAKEVIAQAVAAGVIDMPSDQKK